MAYAAQYPASNDCYPALVAGLAREFGESAAEGLARAFIDAEDADFHWQARIEERLLGSFCRIDEDDVEFDRMAVWGRLQDRYYVAVVLVDDQLAVQGMLGLRHFDHEAGAWSAFADVE